MKREKIFEVRSSHGTFLISKNNGEAFDMEYKKDANGREEVWDTKSFN